MERVAVRRVRFEEEPQLEEKPSLTCAACGYGVARQAPPDRCPMCQSDAAWIQRWLRPSA